MEKSFVGITISYLETASWIPNLCILVHLVPYWDLFLYELTAVAQFLL
jgi:hypothetical protein